MAHIESNNYDKDKREAEFRSYAPHASNIGCIKILEYENNSTLTTSEIHLNLRLNSPETLHLLNQLRFAVEKAMKWAVAACEDNAPVEMEDL